MPHKLPLNLNPLSEAYSNLNVRVVRGVKGNKESGESKGGIKESGECNGGIKREWGKGHTPIFHLLHYCDKDREIERERGGRESMC